MSDGAHIQRVEGGDHHRDENQDVNHQADQPGQLLLSQGRVHAHLFAQPVNAHRSQQAGHDALHDAGREPTDHQDHAGSKEIGQEGENLFHQPLDGFQ